MEFETYELRQARENVQRDLQPFFDAVVEEVARHVPEKGYSYRDPKVKNFMVKHLGDLSFNVYRMVRDISPTRTVTNTPGLGDNLGELLDITAMAGFVWSHLEGAWSIKNGERRSP